MSRFKLKMQIADHILELVDLAETMTRSNLQSLADIKADIIIAEVSTHEIEQQLEALKTHGEEA